MQPAGVRLPRAGSEEPAADAEANQGEAVEFSASFNTIPHYIFPVPSTTAHPLLVSIPHFDWAK